MSIKFVVGVGVSVTALYYYFRSGKKMRAHYMRGASPPPRRNFDQGDEYNRGRQMLQEMESAHNHSMGRRTRPQPQRSRPVRLVQRPPDPIKYFPSPHQLLEAAALPQVAGGDYNPSQYKPEARKRSGNKSEERCRDIFEEIFRYPFPSVRPSWLKNPATGRNLELDGLCDKIPTPIGYGIAFEYDGVQHAQYGHFHASPSDFIYQTKKDNYKTLRCKEEGILLVRIPHTVAFEDLERYIRWQLEKKKVI